ncbi:hypothetical protein BS50DRAFT_650942 [Corynespora cassiicola Philippines]|uniref:Arrestin-like N-terminal domain-containing protein n=1 Tax=Corynespora cassiicola Philippines TaxID=1448308 RepID=A0A2T2N850_CORCC|nr:hypothetical protein BS50DRAFT_650942 [Corynespora cassiicola Philippines]
MDISITFDYPEATYTNGEVVSGKVILFCPSTITLSKIAVNLIGETKSILSGAPGLLTRRKIDEFHRIFPVSFVTEKSKSESIKLQFGYHSFPFALKIPWLPKCESCPPKTSVSRILDDKETQLGPPELPPSMKEPRKGAEVIYRVHIAVTILRNMFKSTFRKHAEISVWPLDTRPVSIGSMCSGDFSSFSTVEATIMGSSANSLSPTGTGDDLLLLPSTTGTSKVRIAARFPSEFSLTCARDISMRIDIEKLDGHESDLYLQSFQALLVGYTDVRVGTTTQVQMAFWMVQSLSNLGLKVFSSDDEEGTVNEIDPALWRDKPLHGSVVPSFQSCNLERRYELELLLGFQCNSPKARILFVQLRTPVRVFSGITPGRRLSVDCRYPYDARSMSEKGCSSTGPTATNGFGHEASSLVSGQSMEFSRASMLPSPYPPTYEEATIASVNDGLQREYGLGKSCW